ncbi:S-layer homology domain-containing protein [Halobacillus sp. BBL2006]|uniref:S-layer homology domain-containing protein n=1 Tax=Halobacillus sp. BBL2006 TaxID=1543706 RepID=UPI0005429522|nr:S-layer homology domain-containing protein [Halobacillus sp. BBL2006]KHE72806.1 hypothetical protein LD39_02600 [Halobacillus sp. BBL2006]
MKNRFLHGFLLTVAFVVSFSSFSSFVTYADQVKVDYVALGDSLAAGVTPESTPENPPKNGYADYLARHINELGSLQSYEKRYAVPGYTSQNVINDLIADVKKPSEALDPRGLRTAVSNAEIVTVSAGANDMLRTLKIDGDTGETTIDLEKFEQSLQTVGKNLTAIYAEVKGLNPEVDVYFMGYYNPYPYLPSDQKAKLDTALQQLNNVIQQAAAATGVSYVPTSEQFQKQAKNLLPDPTNIHPNKEGHLVIANQFWKAFELQEPTEFNDVDNDSYAFNEINELTAKGILKGYGDGSFGPNDSIKRSHASIMLTRSIIFHNEDMPADPDFSDIWSNMASYSSIARLTEEGVIDGFPGGMFKPNESLTREQMAKILVTALKLESKHTDLSFPDVDEDSWAYPYIKILAEHEITLGHEDGEFKPKQEVTREQLAAFLARSMRNE